MSELLVTSPKAVPRLTFIDMARSIAILLMLEGHFIHDSLANYAMYESGDYPVFQVWSFIRGYTSSIFLTVTGLVFVYLLLMRRSEPFFSNIRIKKGFKRVIELLFWGYLLQYYAFHVLQCIGISILFILLLFGLYKLLKVIPLSLIFGVFGIGLIYLKTYLIPLEANLIKDPSYGYPENAPYFIQNMILANPNSRAIFPLIPHMGFVMLGAMLGSLLHDLQRYVRTWKFAFAFIFSGIIIYFFNTYICGTIDSIISYLSGKPFHNWFRVAWLFEKFGMVLMVLGILMLVEKSMGNIKQNLFLKIGQNTLTIFILHFMVLYGSITGLGLYKHINGRLSPIQATIGAILFISIFILFVKHFEWIKDKLGFILKPISRFTGKIFGIKA